MLTKFMLETLFSVVCWTLLFSRSLMLNCGFPIWLVMGGWEDHCPTTIGPWRTSGLNLGRIGHELSVLSRLLYKIGDHLLLAPSCSGPWNRWHFSGKSANSGVGVREQVVKDMGVLGECIAILCGERRDYQSIGLTDHPWGDLVVLTGWRRLLNPNFIEVLKETLSKEDRICLFLNDLIISPLIRLRLP